MKLWWKKSPPAPEPTAEEKAAREQAVKEYWERQTLNYRAYRRAKIEQAVDEAWDGVKYAKKEPLIIPAQPL